MPPKIFDSDLPNAWCPGCGNFGILQAFKLAMEQLKFKPQNVLLVSGIGQAGKLPHYTRANVFNSLHGRAIPVAEGAKAANPALSVIAIGGDGDGYGEGGNHWLHAMRRNHDLTYLVHDNQVYGLTKGQASPTSDLGYVSKTTLYGALPPIDPVALAITAGATFVARGFAGDIEHLASLIVQGVRHRGFSLIDILQPCVTFNKENTFAWYKERVYKLDEKYDPSDKAKAYRKAEEWGKRIPIGVIYVREKEPTFEDVIGVAGQEPVAWRALSSAPAAKLMREFM